MSNGNGHHWSKFCWRDWSGDAALRDCSLSAKGFWIGILALMHEGEPVGHLTIGGKPATIRQMASNVNCTPKQAGKALAELEAAGVFSRTSDGTIYSRRMDRDARAADAAREWGKAGGNPNLKVKANSTEPAQPPPKPSPPEPSRVNPTLNPQGYRPPNPPPLTPGLTGGLSLELESQVQPEKEKKVSNLNNLPSTSPVLARAETHGEAHAAAVRQLQADALQALMNEAGIAEPATETTILEADEGARLPPSPIAAGPTKAHVNRVAKARAMQIPHATVRGPAEQIERNEAQPEVADAAGLKWRPAEAVRTLEQQIAELTASITPEQAEKARTAFAERAR